MSNANKSDDPITADARHEWAASAALRAEFGGNLDWYTALRRAEARGIVKVPAPARERAASTAHGASAAADAEPSLPSSPESRLRRESLVGLDIEGLVDRTVPLPELPIGLGRFRFSTLAWPKFLKAHAAETGLPWWVVALHEPSIYVQGNVDLALCRDELRKAIGNDDQQRA